MIDYTIVICCAIWAFTVLVLGCLFYLYMCKKAKLKFDKADNERQHEKAMKELTFEQEQYWFFQKKLEPEFEKELKDKIDKLEKEKEDLSKQLNDEKENRENKLKKERLQAEHDFYEKILSQVYSAKEKPFNK